MVVSTPLGPDKLLLVGFEGTEQISGLFSFRLDLLATNANSKDIKFDKLLGQELAVTMVIDNPDPQSSEVKVRHFRGICRRFEQGNRDTDFTTYRAEIVPQFWLTTRTAQSRIFQQISVPDILKKVLTGLKVDYSGLQGTFEKREYCVQYRETDFNFVCRLMEEEGIFYFFKHTKDAHELVIANSASAHPNVPGITKVQWEVEEGQDLERRHIYEWVKRQEVRSGKFAMWDHSFQRPDDNFESKKNTLGSVAVGKVTHKLEVGGNEKFEIYDYPGEFAQRFDGISKSGGDQGELGKISPDGTRTVELRMQAETLAGLLIEGSSNCNQFTSGHKFVLEKHFDAEGSYVLTSVHHVAHGGNAYRTGDDTGFTYSNSFGCIPDALPFRPQRTTPKPCVMGAQTAVVVGPAGEEIFTDKYGRVKVQFHWDRASSADANSSCWLRVGTAWAGKGWGSIHIPRIGHEVIVNFMEGDPDAPIIIGSVYNAGAMPPYKLPDEKTKSTIKSLSSKGGGGFNEMRFEDKKGSEQIFIHAEKNQDIRVKNDTFEWIGHEKHLIVIKDQYIEIKGKDQEIVKGNVLTKIGGDFGETVKGSHHSEVDGSDHLIIKGDHFTNVTGDENQKFSANLNLEAGGKISMKSGKDIHGKSGANYAMEAAQEVHIKAGTKLILEASAQISLVVGGNFIDIGPAGVAIKGTMVMINSGGAAGSGSGSSPTAPVAAEPPDPPKEAKVAADAKPGEKDKPPAKKTPPKPADYSAAALVLIAAAAAGTPFCEECARAAQEDKEEELAVITSIAWLDGAKDKEVASATQWVNLPHEAKWVDEANGVANIDRVGQKIRYKVTFSKPGGHSFKVKAEPGDDNAVYTGPEEGRNAKFKWMKESKTYTTDGDGTKVVEADFFSTCAGLDSFKLVAEDTNNSPPVETGFVKTSRLVYVVVIKMKGMTSNVDLGTLRGEYSKHGIEMVELPAVEIDRMANIGPAEEDAYKRKCKTAFNGSKGKDKMPYAVAVGFTEHLAVKNPSQVIELTGVPVGPGSTPAEIPVMARGLRSGDGLRARKLWKDLVPGESWFVSATFTPDGGGGGPRNIVEAKCTALPDGSSSCGTVKVDVADLPAGSGTLRVTVNVVDRMRGGLSFSDGNLICICTKAWWQDQGAGTQSSTAVHEMGHKVGMVADGTGKLPDKVETQYIAKGHLGPHCFFDLGEMDTYAGVSGNKCVMFGAVGSGSPTDFCEKCIPAVRKMDLSTGWTA